LHTCLLVLPFNEKPSLKFFKTLILWILALQLLNMSICSDAYWFYYNDGSRFSQNDKMLVDPTESIVELLVEMKLGQQDAFTYDQHSIDPQNAVKAIACQIDLENEWSSLMMVRTYSRVYYTDFISHIEPAPLEILSPPPDSDTYCRSMIS
jgi:hypothetical protein